MEESLQNDTAKPAAKSYLGVHRKWLAILLLPLVSLSCWMCFIGRQPTRCPLELIPDPHQKLVFKRFTLGLTNRSDWWVQLAPGTTRLKARVAGKWIPVNTVIQRTTLLPFSQTLIVADLPKGTDRCQLKQDYQMEISKWRLWRKLGPTAQKAMQKCGVFRLFWGPTKRFSEFPDKRRPWKRTVQEVVIPPEPDPTK